MVMVILREAAAGLYLLSPGTDTFHFHTNRIKFFNSSLNIFIDIYCSLPFIYLQSRRLALKYSHFGRKVY